jgi:hypothetical protein
LPPLSRHGYSTPILDKAYDDLVDPVLVVDVPVSIPADLSHLRILMILSLMPMAPESLHRVYGSLSNICRRMQSRVMHNHQAYEHGESCSSSYRESVPYVTDHEVRPNTYSGLSMGSQVVQIDDARPTYSS